MATADRIAVERGHSTAIAHLLGNHAATLCMVQDFTPIGHSLEIVRDDHFRLR
jgi:hypothetical protein